MLNSWKAKNWIWKKNTYWHYHFTEKGFAKNLDPIFLFFKLSPVKIFFTTAKYRTISRKVSSIKWVRSDFVNLDTPPRANTRLVYIPSPSSTSVRTLFFKEDMTGIYFVNYYQSKNHKRYKIKKLLYKAIGKMSNQNFKKSPAIEFPLFSCTKEMEMDHFSYLNSSFYFISIL